MMTVIPFTQTDLRPAPPLWQRRIVWIALLIVVANPWSITAMQRALLAAEGVYRQHRFLTYEFPASHVVYETDATAGAQLLRQKGYHLGRVVNPSADASAAPSPVAYLPALPWGDVAIGCMDQAAFVHERTSAGGTRRAILVEILDLEPTADGQRIQVSALTATPGPAGSLHGDAKYTNLYLDVPRDQRLTVYAGTPDATDPSRFSIPYQLGPHRATISGRLSDDGTVKLHCN